MRSKRQTTMAKLQRERNVKERRERKLEKRAAAAAVKAAGLDGVIETDDLADDPTPVAETEATS